MTSLLRSLIIAAFFALVSCAAFVPQHQPGKMAPQTVMHFKFLKDLGLEKPSWLPDFGGKKEEEPSKPVAVAAEEGEEAKEEATEEAEE